MEQKSSMAFDLVKNAFSSYVRTCLQHASRDYFKKQLRELSHTSSLDKINIQVAISSETLLQGETRLFLSIAINPIKLTPIEKKCCL